MDEELTPPPKEFKLPAFGYEPTDGTTSELHSLVWCSSCKGHHVERAIDTVLKGLEVLRSLDEENANTTLLYLGTEAQCLLMAAKIAPHLQELRKRANAPEGFH